MPTVNVNHTDIESIFKQCFFDNYNTVLVGGADEPLYQPSTHALENNTIYYRADYISSALHEIAHWCIAGENRRKQVDYGYWYSPDGRNSDMQRKFEQSEIKPQALECAFSLCIGIEFRVSVDNLGADISDEYRMQHEAKFSQKVRSQLRLFVENGFSYRADHFIKKLQSTCGSTGILEQSLCQTPD